MIVAAIKLLPEDSSRKVIFIFCLLKKIVKTRSDMLDTNYRQSDIAMACIVGLNFFSCLIKLKN